MPPPPARPFVGPDAIGGLRIFFETDSNRTGLDGQPDSLVQVEPDSKVFREVTRWVHFGLCMLESREGRQSLIECGNRAVSGWNRRGQPHNFRNYGRSMRFCVDFFLQSIRRRFPDIYLHKTIRGDSSTHRMTWGAHLEDYDPKVAVIHRFHGLVRSSSIDKAIYSTFPSTVRKSPANYINMTSLLSILYLRIILAVITYVNEISGQPTRPKTNTTVLLSEGPSHLVLGPLMPSSAFYLDETISIPLLPLSKQQDIRIALWVRPVDTGQTGFWEGVLNA